MKFKKLHFLSTVIVAALFLLLSQSNSGGITGASTSGCNCHATTASAATIISITGMPASYVQGTAYPLTLTVTNAAKLAAGFDMTVNIGTFTASSTGTLIVGGTELRHTTPKPLASGTTSWTFTWTAPATGTTAVTFSTAANAVNLNSTNDPGDVWNTNTLIVPAAPVSTAPIVVVGTPSAITNTTATINGTVNANGNSTTVSVQYGTTIAYGSTGTVVPGTVTGSTATAVSSALSGLTINTLYHYRIVAVSSAGTTNSPDFTFTTTNTASLPTITVGAPTAITNTTATVNGTVNANNGSTAVSVEYGTTTAYGSTGTVVPGTVTGSTATNVSSNLSGLLPNTLYHYRINGVNSAGTTNSPDNTFTTTNVATPPTVTVSAATFITATGATVNGTVNANGVSTNVTVEWGTTTAYGSSMATTPATVTGSTATAVSAAITGLTASTLYHYRIVATSTAGTTNSADFTFTTAAPPAAPAVTLLTVSAITSNSANLRGTVDANNATATVTFEYGLTTAYGSIGTSTPGTVTGTNAQLVQSAISGLLPSTLYHYRIVAVNSVGTTNSADGTFTTLAPPTAPIVALTTVTGITFTGATVRGTVNATGDNATVTFEYGLTTAYGSTMNATPNLVTGTNTTNVQAALTGLTPNTLYHYRLVAVNGVGTTNSADGTFTTLNNTVAPTITPDPISSLGATNATVNATVNAGNAATTVTVEYGLTTSYGTTLGTVPSIVNGAAATPVSAAITGLSANTIYHYRFRAVNAVGTVLSPDLQFTTTAPGQSPIVSLTGAHTITAIGATIDGQVNANNSATTVRIEYGLTTSYGSSLNATPYNVNGTALTPVTATITSAMPNTLYHYRIKATNQYGTTYSNDDVFTTTGNVAVGNFKAAGFSLYPIPARSSLILTTAKSMDMTVSAANITGSKLAVTYVQTGANQYAIDIEQLPAGAYILIVNVGKEVYTQPFSKM